VLQSLPKNGLIDKYLPKVQNINDNPLNDGENETEDMIIRNFIPIATTSYHENDAISDAFARMQTKTMPII